MPLHGDFLFACSPAVCAHLPSPGARLGPAQPVQVRAVLLRLLSALLQTGEAHVSLEWNPVSLEAAAEGEEEDEE